MLIWIYDYVFWNNLHLVCFTAGSIRRCTSLDSANSSSCMRVAMGCNSFGWGYLACRVSLFLLALQAEPLYLVCLCVICMVSDFCLFRLVSYMDITRSYLRSMKKNLVVMDASPRGSFRFSHPLSGISTIPLIPTKIKRFDRFSNSYALYVLSFSWLGL